MPLKSRFFAAYTPQVAIAAVHAEAESAAGTDWRQIVALYDQLLRIHRSPVVQSNRAVAVAMCDGPEAGLTDIDAALHGEIANYYPARSACGCTAGSAGHLRLGHLMRKLWR